MNGEPAATDSDIDAAVEALAAAGVHDPSKYRWVLEAIAAWGYPPHYLTAYARTVTPRAARHGEVA